MKNKSSLLVLLVITCLVLTLAASSFMVGCAKPTPTEEKPAPIVLKTIAMYSEVGMKPTAWFLFIDRVYSQSEGQLILDYIGGPEAIPYSEQPEALISGVIDVLAIWGSLYDKYIPEAALLSLTRKGETCQGYFGLYPEPE